MQNSLTLTAGHAVTMSSREIAQLVEARHSDVVRSIERLMSKDVIGGYAPTAYTHEQNGMEYKEYQVGKRDSYVIVAQLCPEFTARLVDRWQELESKHAPVFALPDFTNPAESARAWALQYEEREKAQAALALAQPKVQFFDKVVERATLMTATQVGQKLGMSAMALNKHLDELDVYSKNIKRARVFKQWFVDKGYGELKQTELGHSQPLFTTSGEAWIIERMVSEGYSVSLENV